MPTSMTYNVFFTIFLLIGARSNVTGLKQVLKLAAHRSLYVVLGEGVLEHQINPPPSGSAAGMIMADTWDSEVSFLTGVYVGGNNEVHKRMIPQSC